ncbi:MAG: cysteine--tRNA ligase [Kiritimatiellia bacterium]
MKMNFYNSMTRRKEEIKPLEDNRIRIYTCGPTVYNFAHIGNFRAYIFEDILRRVIKFNGYEVTQVMNLTDVDDKTIRGAREKGVSLKKFTNEYVQAFFDDLKKLNIEPAEFYPAATDHIAEMIDLIQKLFDNGLAYRSDDGSVYFSVGRLDNYGRLANLDRDKLRAGARVSQDEYEKENYGDFALWKAWDANDGDVVWDSPWGRGRPGWHLECSAMAMKYLGESFDMHTGGIDNLFPHHENEIAQAEGATGKTFVKNWMHCAHLQVNGEKMSKSLGNFFTLRDLIEKGWSGREIRYVLINGHYRQPLNFTFDALDASRVSLARVDECISTLSEKASEADAGDLPLFAKNANDEFMSAVNDDLNIPGGMAVVYNLVRESNSALQAGDLCAGEAAALINLFSHFDQVLGVIDFERSIVKEIPADVKKLLEERAAARTGKNWAESDRIRDELSSMGWSVRDSKDGQKVRKL